MSAETIIVTPEIERGAGGVADYTLRLLEEWGGRFPVRVLVPKRDSALSLPESGGRVLVQYSAYGFDRRGYPRRLLRELLDWRKRTGGCLVVMVHEIWSLCAPWNRNFLRQQLHRRALLRLVAAADATFTTTTDQARRLGSSAEFLPVGTTIGVHPGAEGSRAPGAAVLFGLQGSRLRALRTMHQDLHALAAAGRLARLTTCGAGLDPEETRLLRALPLADGFAQRGALPEVEVSRELAGASFGVLGLDALSLTKSGTFMAYAAHGLNVLSLAAQPTGPAPLCWLTHPEEWLAGIADEEQRARAEKLRAWQEATASWPRIAARFAGALKLEEAA